VGDFRPELELQVSRGLRGREWVKPPVVETEYQIFERWWKQYADTLNSRATLNWVELAWAGWFARSEVAENKSPSIWQRKGPEE
jgi:hypothetical protein